MIRETPCDIPIEEYNEETGKIEIRYRCPYIDNENDYVSCRDMCGLGVDD